MKLIALGIDCGGTHTDAAALKVDGDSGNAELLASAKTTTRRDNLAASVAEAVGALLDNRSLNPSEIGRVTIGATLAVNALAQDKTDKVGLALSAGPGLDPNHFALGDLVCVVPGGLDHRGQEVAPLYLAELEEQARAWPGEGAAAVACVGKFSPRDAAHENKMGEVAGRASGLPVTLGHALSGRLNFPRRVATAYYSAATQRLHNSFLDACERSLAELGVDAQRRLLKADGGAVPFAVSRREPAQSILSGPAASVMGVMALWPGGAKKCALMLDMGGTTTDVALLVNGSPAIDRDGMRVKGRRTLVRSLGSVSVGVGGDSLLSVTSGRNGEKRVCAGPRREGPACAFGGDQATFLDAVNILNDGSSAPTLGDLEKSVAGLRKFALANGYDANEISEIAKQAVADGTRKIVKATYDLVETLNARPIYTLADLKARKDARPEIACLVGGPARAVAGLLSEALGLPVEIAAHYEVANAVGAALTIPSISLEIYADTGKRELRVPSAGYEARIPASLTLDELKQTGLDLLRQKMAAEDMEDGRAEVVEADMFATLDDHGRGAKDLRVVCQARPGIVAKLWR